MYFACTSAGQFSHYFPLPPHFPSLTIIFRRKIFRIRFSRFAQGRFSSFACSFVPLFSSLQKGNVYFYAVFVADFCVSRVLLLYGYPALFYDFPARGKRFRNPAGYVKNKRGHTARCFIAVIFYFMFISTHTDICFILFLFTGKRSSDFAYFDWNFINCEYFISCYFSLRSNKSLVKFSHQMRLFL